MLIDHHNISIVHKPLLYAIRPPLSAELLVEELLLGDRLDDDALLQRDRAAQQREPLLLDVVAQHAPRLVHLAGGHPRRARHAHAHLAVVAEVLDAGVDGRVEDVVVAVALDLVGLALVLDGHQHRLDGERAPSGLGTDAGGGVESASLVKGWREFDCGTTLAIQSTYPNFVVQQISNSLALRLCLPKGPEECELLWWVFGTPEDTEEQREIRIKQSNMIGPGGVISMEDGVVGGWIQRGTKRDQDKSTIVQMGGRDIAPSAEGRATEVSIRGFWQGYRDCMGV